MLVFVIICAVFIGINYLFRYAAKKLISNSKNAKRSVRIRNAYRIIRLIIIVLFTMYIICEFVYIFLHFSELSEFSKPVAYRVYRIIFHIGWRIVVAVYTYSFMSLPISALTIGRFMKKKSQKRFSLFLRGFSSDDYHPELENVANDLQVIQEKLLHQNKTFKKQSTLQFVPFSEKAFTYAVKKYMPIYSIGMSKELESPEGSKRVYLDDETWQNDVSLLIEKATFVFVLVNPSENCLWEVMQCQNKALNKTVYIIDDENCLREVQEKLQYNTPQCLYGQIKSRSIVYLLSNRIKKCPYHNNADGFVEVMKELFEDIKTNPYLEKGKTIETGTVSDRLGIANLNLSDSSDFNIANERIANSTLSKEQKTALSMEIYLVHFGHKDHIEWDTIPSLDIESN